MGFMSGKRDDELETLPSIDADSLDAVETDADARGHLPAVSAEASTPTDTEEASPDGDGHTERDGMPEVAARAATIEDERATLPMIGAELLPRVSPVVVRHDGGELVTPTDVVRATDPEVTVMLAAQGVDIDAIVLHHEGETLTIEERPPKGPVRVLRVLRLTDDYDIDGATIRVAEGHVIVRIPHCFATSAERAPTCRMR